MEPSCFENLELLSCLRIFETTKAVPRQLILKEIQRLESHTFVAIFIT
jgi:hypothetical protein